jgi:tRNA(Ile)-lysidine synthase
VPLLKELNPQLEDTFLRNAFHFQQEAGIVKEFLSNKAVEYATQTHDSLFINRNRLRHEHYIESILHHILSGYGFNGTQQKNITEIVKAGDGIGKKFSTPSHILVVDRNDLVLKPVPQQAADLVIQSKAELMHLAFLKIKALKKFSLPTEKEFVVSASRLVFPLTIRTRRTGDRFRPFGLKGSKLLSDYLKEQKLNTFDKENCSILVNGNKEIMWIMGFRSDDRYRVKGNETDLLKFCIID